MKKQIIKQWAAALLAAVAMTAVAASGVLSTAESAASDALFQHSVATDGEIVIIGMDQYALDQLGPLPWPRSYMADVVAYLNADPETAPAVIGLDILYIGHSGDPDADAALVEAAAMGNNVVVAGAATFGSELVSDGDEFHMDDMAMVAWEAPFEELAEVAEVAHINAMADKDGIIRHNLLPVETPDGTVYSFGRVVYEKYARVKGFTPTPLPITDKDGFFYLPYTAEPGGYDQGISFADVYFGEIDPDYFAGKIVLIGPYAAGMQDEYRTSIEHAVPMYGVEVQANQIDAYRAGFIPREAHLGFQMAFLFLWCLVLLMALRNRKVVTSVLIWLAACIAWIAFSAVSYRLGWVLHVLCFPLMSTIIFVGSVAANYIRAAREKRRITDTFGRYVDPAVLKQLLEQDSASEQLGGKMFDIAVMFVDIRGFTSTSESLDPATVVEILNRYLTLTTECVMRYHGTLDKFVGDCTMAFWNAPLPQDDYAYLACKAAMDMMASSQALGEELQEKYGHTISFGVGIHMGPAVIGNIGAPQRMDYTAIGDTVNTASRLESNAPGGKILISRSVANALDKRAKVTSLGDTIKLKGKSEGFELLTLDALQ